jgi:hypothetical protein
MFSRISDGINLPLQRLDFYLRSIYKHPHPTPLNFSDRQILQELKQEGVSLRLLQALDFKDTAVLLNSIDKVLVHLPSASSVKFSGTKYSDSHSVSVATNELLQYRDIFLWGLQQRWLNLIEHYFQQPIAYLGCVLRRDIPNQIQVGARLWHRDAEDYKVVKIIIYLNDVDEIGGGFEYIPRTISPLRLRMYRLFRLLRYQYCMIPDFDMNRVVPQPLWKKCTGQKGTMVIADTSSIFHHATIPQRERLALTFAYTSAKPKNIKRARKFFPHSDPSAWLHIQKFMSPQQKQIAVDWR